MGDDSSPAVGRRRLAYELRRLRLARGHTIQEVADHLECSPGKVSRIETGVVGAQVRDVRDVLDLYGVVGDERERLMGLVRTARRRGWWHDYARVLPADSVRFLGLEDGASTIDIHSCGLVPGLLQTRDYAAAVVGAATTDSPEVVERRLQLRLRRQALLDRDTPPVLDVVLHEAALVAQVGGPDVLAAQLVRLAEVARRPRVTIRVLPLTAGAHLAAGVSFTVFGFGESGDPPTAHIEQLTGNSYPQGEDEVAVYTAAFADARSAALGPDDSRELIGWRAAALAGGAADRIAADG